MMIGLSGVGRSSLLQRLWKGANAPARPVSNSSRDETSDEFEFEGSKVCPPLDDFVIPSDVLFIAEHIAF